MKTEKYYRIAFLDNKDNELKSFVIRCYSLIDAKKSVKLHFSNCQINDCKKVIATKCNY